jgi:hypothetical protein
MLFHNGKKIGLRYRVVMENHLKRKLKRAELVHHKNGIACDDRLENLQLMSRSEHAILHGTGREMPEKTKLALLHANLGRVFSEESKKKMSNSSTGKRHTEESRKKMSESHIKLNLLNAGSHGDGRK